jgi:adenine-specific DNA-methyltransferase
LPRSRCCAGSPGKLIDFLAQLEDFQKKLWLKKKFVVETNYCITLDRVPEELYPEIAANACAA